MRTTLFCAVEVPSSFAANRTDRHFIAVRRGHAHGDGRGSHSLSSAGQLAPSEQSATDVDDAAIFTDSETEALLRSEFGLLSAALHQYEESEALDGLVPR